MDKRQDNWAVGDWADQQGNEQKGRAESGERPTLGAGTDLSRSSAGEDRRRPPAEFIDAASCAARYGFSASHWRRLVDAGKAPQPTRFGRLVRWAIDELKQWDSAGNPPVRTVKGVRQ